MSYVRLNPDQFQELIDAIKSSGGGGGWTPEEKQSLFDKVDNINTLVRGIDFTTEVTRLNTNDIKLAVGNLKNQVSDVADLVENIDFSGIAEKLDLTDTHVLTVGANVVNVQEKVNLTDTHVLTVGSNVVHGNNVLDRMIARPYSLIDGKEYPRTILAGMIRDITTLETLPFSIPKPGNPYYPIDDHDCIVNGNLIVPRLYSGTRIGSQIGAFCDSC